MGWNAHSPDSMCSVIDRLGGINRVGGKDAVYTESEVIHTENVYNALFNAAKQMEDRLTQSLETYQQHPDVQANLQQLQYDLAQWNLALTTMTNINKSMADALNSIASNFR